ncbi:MAG: trimethylamine methyltransferase, partial [Gammaproteobacteria bacterium]|nr:trimethylamine methyltransferase [Gammaproteobacteria bacterium]
MNLNADTHCKPCYRLLDDEQLQQLHHATLEILEKVGVCVKHPDALELLREGGCKIKEKNTVLIPEYLVADAIQSAPSSVTIYNREGNRAMELGGSNVYFGMGTDLLNTYDLDTGALRQSCLQDVVNAAKVADSLEDIDFIASHAFPNEISTNLAYVAEFKAQVENSTKPIYFTAAAEDDLAYIIDIAAAITGGREELRQKPFMVHYAEPISPLTHSEGALKKLFICSDAGIPLNYVPALLAGGTGPITLAGGLAVANAESLSGLVIQQLYRRGAPMISGVSVTPLDMRTGNCLYGSPDERLTHTASTELYHWYGLPVWGEAGCSDSNALDGQAAMESSFQIMLSALEGCNLVHNVGYMGQGLVGSLGSLVMCAEIISYAKRIMHGFSFSTDHLALDVIQQVGPGGNYLAQTHTAKHCRSEHW